MAEYDVVVVGAGGAGLSAAVEAALAGARVVVLDAAAQVGGATAMSAGVVFAADTSTQRRAGIVDSVEQMYAYYMGISQYLIEPRLVRVACQRSPLAVAWLESLGIEFPVEKLYVAGVEDVPRGHLPKPVASTLGPAAGATIASALLSVAQNAGAHIVTNARATGLEIGETGATVTTESGDQYTASSVVLASGGFGNSRELLAQYWPDATAYGDWHWYIGPAQNVGDGLQMGLQAGGTVVGHNWGQWIETPNFDRIVDPFTPPWLVYVNRDGRRFISEMAPYIVLPDAIAAQPSGRCFAILSDGVLNGPIDDPAFADPYGMGADFESNWTRERLHAQISKGTVLSASTLEGLAVLAGIDPEGLVGTVETYNRDAVDGRDSVFDKPAKLMLPIVDAPYYAVEVRRAVLGMTFAGLRIDDCARVLDRSGRPVPHLFAAGEIVGGLTGPTYPGGGVMITNAVVFGRLAGQGAAAAAQSAPAVDAVS